jgi:myo-inositol-1(or 4)-monophosphatase
MTDVLGFIGETLDMSGSELLGRFGSANNVRMKKDRSLVTDADLASEKVILDRISNYFPADAIISEESGFLRVSRTPGQKVWIVDPLDGTTNFANGFPFFSISIGYGEFQSDGTIKIFAGGIGDPIHSKKYLALAGQGATCNGKKLAVQPSRPFGSCFLVTGFYYTIGKDLDREIERFRKVAQKCQSIRRDGSAALDLALVAEGVYDCFWERGLAIWDVAAGSLIVKETGGTVANYPKSSGDAGKANSASLAADALKLSYNIEGEGIVAGSASIVPEILTLLAE